MLFALFINNDFVEPLIKWGNMLTDGKNLSTITVMEEEHHSLRNTFLMIQAKIDDLVAGHLMLNQKEELIFLFNYFQKRLAFHFNIEESIGVLNDIRESEPHFYDEVMRMYKEHLNLLHRLKDVFNYLKSSDLDKCEIIETLGEKFTTFLNHLKHHEEQETNLVIKASNTGFGLND